MRWGHLLVQASGATAPQPEYSPVDARADAPVRSRNCRNGAEGRGFAASVAKCGPRAPVAGAVC
jgi:hypothetical protein